MANFCDLPARNRQPPSLVRVDPRKVRSAHTDWARGPGPVKDERDRMSATLPAPCAAALAHEFRLVKANMARAAFEDAPSRLQNLARSNPDEPDAGPSWASARKRHRARPDTSPHPQVSRSDLERAQRSHSALRGPGRCAAESKRRSMSVDGRPIGAAHRGIRRRRPTGQTRGADSTGFSVALGAGLDSRSTMLAWHRQIGPEHDPLVALSQTDPQRISRGVESRGKTVGRGAESIRQRRRAP